MYKNTKTDYSKSELPQDTREEVDLDNYVGAYYSFKLKGKYLDIILDYIKYCSYAHEEFDLPGMTSYRHCELNFVPKESKVMKIISGLFKQLNEKHFHYDLSGTCEVQIVKYNKGGNYNWHADYGLSENKDCVRKLSMSIQLTNYFEYEGCEVILCDHSRNYSTLSKELGSGMIFDSKTPHKVTPLTKGQRICLVAWAHGPQLR